MPATNSWTVMVYMAGDNNLSIDMAYALEDLQKKVSVSENDNINLFVHYLNNSPEVPALFCDFSDINSPTYIYSTEIENKYSSKEDGKYTNSEAIDPLVDFVDWCVGRTLRKSDNYALILAGHTMGFLSHGLFKNESKNVSMTMPGLQMGLETIKDNIIGKKLSMLGFDSCVMGMLEVGQQFEEVADTMIASEGSIPNAGWSYAEILGTLTKEKSEVTDIASKFVEEYIKKQSKYAIGGVSVDMAAWNLGKLNGLTNKFGRFARILLKCFEDESAVVYKQMGRILLHVHFNSQTYMFEQCLDLGDFCSLLIEEITSLKYETSCELDSVLLDLYTSSKSVLQEIDNCIILSGFSGGTYQYSTGISLFFPWSLNAYEVSLNDYEQLNFVAKTEAGKLWNSFLQKYLCEVSRRKARTIESEDSLDIYTSTELQQNQIATSTR